MSTRDQCRRALDLHEAALSGLQNVVGLGVVPSGKAGPRGFAVAVYVRKKVARDQLAAADVVPPELEIPGRGTKLRVPTEVIEQGEVSLEIPSTKPA